MSLLGSGNPEPDAKTPSLSTNASQQSRANTGPEGLETSLSYFTEKPEGQAPLFVLNTLRVTANFKPMKIAPTGIEPRPSALEGNAQANCTTSTL